MSTEQALQLALQRHRREDFAAAETIYRQVLRADPRQPEVLNLLGLVAFQTGRLSDAIELFRRAVVVRPDFAGAWHNLGKALHLQGRSDEALAAYSKAIAFSSNHVEACCDFATLLAEKGQIHRAIQAYRQALSHKPDFALAHYNLSLLLLLEGEYREGFRQHEWRWRARELDLIPRHFTQPQWKGENLNGRTILLHAEQGFGDAIQFIRYAPLVAERGGKVIVECHAALERLFCDLPGIRQVVVEDSPLPEFDLHCPLHSLPLAMDTTIETIPASIPYLRVDEQLVSQWRDRLKNDSSALRIGLVWAGRESHDNDRNRSIALKDLEPLAHVAGVSLYSLQKGQAIAQAGQSSQHVPLVDFANELNDFADTAALIENLDLVISVDTSVAHLAGALGTPTWVLLPFLPDWRWMQHRTDSPWYPTMRLFRQSKSSDWNQPIEELLQALVQAVAAAQTGESCGQSDLSMHPTPSRNTPRRIPRPLVPRATEPPQTEQRNSDRLHK